MTRRQVITFFLPSLIGGGAERVMLTLANQFAKRGEAVDVVVASADGPLAGELSSDINLVNLKKNSVIAGLPQLCAYMVRVKPTTVYSTMTHANTILIFANMLTGNRARIIVREANLPNLAMDLKNRLIRKVAALVYNRADVIVSVSTPVEKAVIDTFRIRTDTQTRVIANPVITDEFFEKAQLPPDPAIPGVDSHQMILGVGRLTPEKGFEVLIKAFDKAALANTKLVIIGEGPDRDRLEKLVASTESSHSIFLPGFVHNPFPYFSAADLFVLSSYSEGSPNALIQALALDTRVIANRLSGVTEEILEDGRQGMLVNSGAVDELVPAIRQSLKQSAEQTPEQVSQQSTQHGDTEQAEVVDWSALYSVTTAVNEYLKLAQADQAGGDPST